MTVIRETSAVLRQDPPPAQPPLEPRRIELGRRARSVFMGLVWLGFGTVVLVYGGTLVYANVAMLEVSSALVVGTVEPLKASETGTIAAMRLRPGMTFAAGDHLFSVHDPDLELLVALAAVRLDRARHDLLQREAERSAALVRRDDFVRAARIDVEQADTLVQAQTEFAQIARSRLGVVTGLFAQGYVTRARLEEATDRAAETASRLIRLRIGQREKREMLEAALAGRGHDGVTVIGNLPSAEASVTRAEAEVGMAVEELRVRMERRNHAVTTATAPGRVLRVLRLGGAAVRSGDPVAIIERNETRVIHALLTQSEISRVSLGDEAQVFLPAQRLTAMARVVAVERAGAFLDDVETRYSWHLERDQGIRLSDRDRTARVVLQFEADERDVAQRVVELGTPAVVTFDRRWNSRVFAAFEPMARSAGMR